MVRDWVGAFLFTNAPRLDDFIGKLTRTEHFWRMLCKRVESQKQLDSKMVVDTCQLSWSNDPSTCLMITFYVAARETSSPDSGTVEHHSQRKLLPSSKTVLRGSVVDTLWNTQLVFESELLKTALQGLALKKILVPKSETIL